MENKNQENVNKVRKLKLHDLLPAVPAFALCACIIVSVVTYKAPVYAVEKYDADEFKITRKSTDEDIEIGKGSFDLEDGTYDGTGVGYAGAVNVKVTIKDKTITAIDVVSNSDTASFFSKAKATVIKEILEEQTYEVDSVSGATYSSRGIKNAVKNAITGEVDNSSVAGSSSNATTTITTVEESGNYKDGTYTGTGTGYGGPVTVKVTIKDGEIAAVTIVSNSDTASYFNRAKAVTSRIVANQTTNVDGVSGATFSSKGIIEATRNALSKASGDEETEAAKTTTTVTPSKSGMFPYPDGTYTGTGEGRNGDITVAVTIKNSTVTKIVVVSSSEDTPYLNSAMQILDEIIINQTTDVDGVSGATLSSNGLREATVNAIAKARAAANSKNKEKEETNTTNKDVDSEEKTETEDSTAEAEEKESQTEQADETEEDPEKQVNYGAVQETAAVPEEDQQTVIEEPSETEPVL